MQQKRLNSRTEEGYADFFPSGQNSITFPRFRGGTQATLF
jgi:hypothetical protein